MDFNFVIPPKPPDINLPTSPGAFITVNDDDCSSSSSKMEYSEIQNSSFKEKNKKNKKKHSLKRHKPDCSKISKVILSQDTSAPLTQTLITQNILDCSQMSPIIPQPSSSNTNHIQYYYTENDKGPFVVHIQKKTSSDNNLNNTTINPIIFGKLMLKHSFHGIVPGSVTRIGRNRLKLSFNSFKEANNFVNNSIILEQGYNAFIPSFCVTKMGVIRVPTDIDDNDIKLDAVIPHNPTKILKIRRLNYKTIIDGIPTWKPSQSVVVTFEGQVLPEYVYLYYNKINVQSYRYPTIQCYTCCRFGHTKNNCRAKPRCYKCGQGHTGDTCGLDESESCCLICSGNHFATSKKCPELVRQQNIKSLMSNNSISYMEANKIEPRVNNKSYAEIAKTSYKKTVTLKPKPIKPNLNKGYDIEFHKKMAKDFLIPNTVNGCALNTNNNVKNDENISSEITLNSILLLLVQLLKNKSIPENVDINSNNLLSFINNNGFEPNKDNSMELSKSTQKEN